MSARPSLSSGRPTSGPPRLAWHNQGLASYPNSTTLQAMLGLEARGRICACGAFGGQTHVGFWSSSAGWSTADLSGESVAPAFMWADTAGNIFIALNDVSKLYRIAYDSTTPTLVLSAGTTPAFQAANNRVMSMAEDDQGTLWAVEYQHSIGLYKSLDRGLTWERVVDGAAGFPGSGLVPNTHLHVVAWDQWRKQLLCSLGDATGSYVQVSDDHGATWSSWVSGLEQATAIVPAPEGVYLTGDYSTDHDIYLGTYPSAATSVFDPANLCEPSWTDPIVDGGFAWLGWRTEDGDIVFPYGAGNGPAYCVVLQPSGAWVAFKTRVDDGAYGFAHKPTESLSAYGPWRYGRIDGYGGGSSFVAWRIARGGVPWQIDEGVGRDFHFADGKNVAITEPRDYGIPWQVPYQLAADYSGTVTAGMDRLRFEKNGFDVVGTVSYVSASDQDCEGSPLAPAWTTQASTVTLQSTTQVKEGTYSVKLAKTATGTNCRMFRNQVWDNGLTAGNEHAWCSYWQYIEAIALGSGANQLTQIQETSHGGNYLMVQYDPDSDPEPWSLRLTLDGGDATFYPVRHPALPVGRWAEWKIHIYRHAVYGRIQFWIEDELLFDVEGVNTLGANASNWDIHVGINYTPTSTSTATIYIDDIKCGYSDPDEPSGLVLDGQLQSEAT